MAYKNKEQYNAYMNDYMKRRYQQRRELAFATIGDKCVRCKTKLNLQIDHVYWSDKTFDFGKHWNCSLKRFMEELEKCQPLCKTCHDDKSKRDISERRFVTRSGANQYGPC